MTPAPSILTTAEAARLLRLSADTIRSLVNSGKLPCIRINRRNWRFRRATLEAWLERKET